MKFICLSCFVEFESLKKDKNRTPKYCSRKCYSKRKITDETRKRQSEARLGKSPWNKDKKMWDTRVHPRGTLGKKGLGKNKFVSLETRKKQSLSHIGIKLPERSGKNHHFWKGGITPENVSIRKSTEYTCWRKKVFERDNFTCTECKKKGGYLHVDHILPFSLYPDKRFDIENGRVLCIECHKNTKTYGGKIHSLSKKMKVANYET